MLQPSDSQKSQFPSNLPLKTAGASVEQSTIGGSVVIKGEVSGSESLYIEGHIEGTVDFTDHRVTIGSALSPPTSVPAKLSSWAKCTATSNVRTVWRSAAKVR